MKTLKTVVVLLITLLIFSTKAFSQNSELKILIDSGIVAIQKANYDAIISIHEKALPLAEKETVKKDSLVEIFRK